MLRLFRLLPVAILFATTIAFAQTQTTLSNETSNNTSACSGTNAHCSAAFTGMSSSSSGIFNAAPGNVSHEDMHEMEYSGATTEMYVHFLPWFCMQPGSTATGPGTSCNSHIQVGYNSNDPATVKSQMDDMQSRGFRGPIIDWYGPGNQVADSTTQVVRSNLEARCSGGSCPMQFAINEDQGSATRTCKMDGGGTDQTNCILQSMEGDFDYMNTNYFRSPAYLRVDANTMQYSPNGRPVVFFFFCESCFTNPTPNWITIFTQLRQHVLAYTSGDPLIWFIFRNSVAFTHTQSDGGFAWVNHYGSNDPYGLAYLDNFYDVSLRYPRLQPWGAAWKGFDNSLAPWNPALSVTPQQCGNTWVQTWAEMTHNNDYGPSHQLPFLQVVTWNDYEEGTPIESGIDNCLSLTASTDGTNLSWKPSFSSASGSEATVHHYEVFDSTDGQNLTQVATVPAGTNAVPLSSLNLVAGSSHTMYVEAVGKGSILNKLSNPVSYSPTQSTITVTGVSPNSGSTGGGAAVTISGTNFQPGAAVSFGGVAAAVNNVTATAISAVTPAHVAGAVNVTVTNPDTTNATANSAFTYVAPVVKITGVSPNSGTTAGGTSITITGQNFQSGAKITVGGSAATVSNVNGSSISAVTPAHTAGAVTVTVTNPDGTTASAASAFTYVAPVQPSFTLSASPTSKTVYKGSTATYSITVSPKSGYTGTVRFGVSGLPSGATASFSPTSVTTSGTTRLSIGTSRSTRGTFALRVTGSNSTGTITNTISVGLTVR